MATERRKVWNADDLFDALGGTAWVARRCRCSDAAVSQWRVRGVPPLRKIFLMHIADWHGIDMDPAWLRADIPAHWWQAVTQKSPHKAG